MIEQNESFPDDFGVDYCLMWINTDKYPSYISRPHPDSGEITHEVEDNSKSFTYTLPILIDPDGINVVPANLYLHSLLSNSQISSVKTIESHAVALLSFYRWMNLEIPEHTDPRTGVLVEEKRPLTIYDCTEKVEESPVVRYRDYLLENLYIKDENGKIGGSPNTASSYVLKVVAYYTYLHRQRIVPLSKTFRPFEFSAKKVRIRDKNKRAQHDMLSHLYGYNGNDIIVYTTGLTKPFKNIQKPQNADIRELRPLREDEKQALYRYLDVENSSDTKALMLYLKTEVGLRLEELITFPTSVVDKPKAKVVKVPIGERINGCLTKYRKDRTIEIPAHVMELLYEYKLSKARKEAIENGLLRHNHLFVQSNGNIYAPNTIQKYVEAIRNDLIISGLDIYFSPHDLRATFATDWLYNKHIETGKPFEALMSELADLMGHKSTDITQKYISYMNDDKTWSEFAQRKNQFAQQSLR
ncbi:MULTISPECIES: tyrosine-type recombinase/integrase [Vibrio]|uniref:Integrase n=1 Tax=Vibrio aestuarianus TaxID=28171 RepID=A0ABM9FTV7_9VIBR|nr:MULTISPECIES: site-specific integrase [Vibrio]MCF4175554.1 site-specific integrase [Vibrio sp. McD22-P3]MDE1214039.1 site-specific integrase [Vibrio aestuarianus]MDE1218118.1 site-specific integrase [Vibrio aestuarianus]MDE1257847.1 site-specific integrase [Vibrio aestuarianus]MDE1261768.1 site-specific integrase [Vibrio aestuarianus]